ncbi:hypothetical protein PLICRDRAFT_38251 [Plicaturopsis crispa FD-325 SS-3]|nr:hypothetical protein PLICRDRAFT_38251 [Plicaturopsis crispa FD-325 SS-3]
MAAAAHTQRPADSWDIDQPSASTSQIQTRRRIPSAPIHDDWDASSDDEEEADFEKKQQKLWEDANARAPMPQIVIAKSSASIVVAPPPTTMRILKRPSSTNATPTLKSSANGNQGETLKEREAKYHAARERIFGEPQPGGKTNAESGTSKPKVGVLRNPKGPAESTGKGEGEVAKGFGKRRNKAKKDPGRSPPNATP